MKTAHEIYTMIDDMIEKIDEIRQDNPVAFPVRLQWVYLCLLDARHGPDGEPYRAE
jgi:hypothetical protein